MSPSRPPGGRIAALGTELIEIHLRLREELDQLREDVDAHLAGATGRSGGRPGDLRLHCLAFCSALSGHHTDEDSGTFPALAERHPELRPVLEQLEHDHQMVAGILRNLQELVDGIADDPGPGEATRVRGELDGLTALLESHFAYEEKKLVAVLDAQEVAEGHG